MAWFELHSGQPLACDCCGQFYQLVDVAPPTVAWDATANVSLRPPVCRSRRHRTALHRGVLACALRAALAAEGMRALSSRECRCSARVLLLFVAAARHGGTAVEGIRQTIWQGFVSTNSVA